MNIDLYTPWHDEPGQLLRRHVGRPEVREALAQAGAQHFAGKSPVHLYVYGPRGMGKSHLLAMTEQVLRPLEGDAKLVILPEDVPVYSSAQDLLEALARTLQEASWDSWKRPAVDLQSLRGAVVLFEGLDRQLEALKESERRLFRAFVTTENVLLIGSGVGLGKALTDKRSAFYGGFSTWPLSPLDEEDAGVLLDEHAGETASTHGWPGRRSALLKLAGGSPRTLVALGLQCCRSPESWASADLFAVLQQFTAHYQMRFRDLSPQGQSVLALLCEAPRKLSPKEIAEILGQDARSIATACRRMNDHGLLEVEQEGRRSWYSVAEPLFRFWHEYRTGPWEQTRVALLGRLLEAVATPEELVSGWMSTQDLGMREAFEAALARSPVASEKGWRKLLSTIAELDDAARLSGLLNRAKALPINTYYEQSLVESALQLSLRAARPALQDFCTRSSTPQVAAWGPVIKFLAALEDGRSARVAFGDLIAESSDFFPMHGSVEVAVALDKWRDGLQAQTPWILSPSEKEQLGRVPHLRIQFCFRGLETGHPGLISVDDIDFDVGVNVHPVIALMSVLVGDIEMLGRVLIRIPYLMVHTSPEVVAPGHIDELCELCFVVSHYQSVWEYDVACEISRRHLSWAATWTKASPPVFSRLVDRIDEMAKELETDGYAQTALLSLGYHAPDRLQAVIDALAANPEAHKMASQALNLSRQLHEHKVAPLQPELQAMLDLIAPPETR